MLVISIEPSRSNDLTPDEMDQYPRRRGLNLDPASTPWRAPLVDVHAVVIDPSLRAEMFITNTLFRRTARRSARTLAGCAMFGSGWWCEKTLVCIEPNRPAEVEVAVFPGIH